MEPELTALASAGAVTLVGLMVSDSWAQVKDGVARMLARGKEGERVAEDLDVSRAALLTATEPDDERVLAAVEGEWRARLFRLLQADPLLVRDVRRLVEAPGESGAASDVHNVTSGGVQHGPVIQAGRISGVEFHQHSEE